MGSRETPAVLVHGLVVSGSYMIPLAERLAPHCPVFAVDLPGYGRSSRPGRTLTIPEQADTLEEWLAAKCLMRVNLIGNSMGCQVIAEYAARYQARVGRIVFLGPTVDRAARSFPRQFWGQIRNVPYEKPAVWPIIAKDYLAAGLPRVLATIREALRDRIEEKLPHLQVPVLVVRGEKDPVCPAEWAAEVLRLLPCGELRVIPGGAHILNFSMPVETVRVMRPFLGL